jgi:hypothetical protein
MQYGAFLGIVDFFTREHRLMNSSRPASEPVHEQGTVSTVIRFLE